MTPHDVVPELIVIAGAPGTGKSTLARQLQQRWPRAPYIELSSFREFHLREADWSDQSVEDEEVAWENLVFCVRTYARRGWTPVIVTDLREQRVQQVPGQFGDLQFAILTLVANDETIRERVGARTEGFVAVDKALAWNHGVRERDVIVNETKIDVHALTPVALADVAVTAVTTTDGSG